MYFISHNNKGLLLFIACYQIVSRTGIYGQAMESGKV